MRSFTFDELANLSAEKAVASRLDETNLLLLRWFLPLWSLAALVFTGMALAERSPRLGVTVLYLLIDVVAFFAVLRVRAGRKPNEGWTRWAEPAARLLRRYPRAVTLALLVVQNVFLVLAAMGTEALLPLSIILSYMMVGFRLAPAERLLVHGSYALAVLVAQLFGMRLFGPEMVSDEGPAPVLFNLVFSLVLGLLISRRARRNVLHRFAESQSHVREQVRMRQELDAAREIQLAMLPGDCPAPGWLDVCSLSLPAAEVGGDYYDYFDLGAGRLAVVAGDVAGHGMASGLMLAGLRSGLTLLADEGNDPAVWMEKLDRMIQRTSRRRTLVTLAVVTFDAGSRTAEVVNAGHPPLLVARAASGEVTELAADSLPLGVPLRTTLARRSLVLAPGDTLLLYSDGLYETTDATGEAYGFERLAASLARHLHAESALKLRDGILADLWSFKGHEPPQDDITFVVVRVKDEPAPREGSAAT